VLFSKYLVEKYTYTKDAFLAEMTLAFDTGECFKEVYTIQMQALYEVIFLFYEAYQEPNSIDTVPVKAKFVPESGFSLQRSKVFSSTSISDQIFGLDS